MFMPTPRSTRTDTLFPVPTLFRSARDVPAAGDVGRRLAADHRTRRGGALCPRPARSAGGDGARPHHRADGAARALRRPGAAARLDDAAQRSEEHTSELQSLMRISYAVFCLKKKN